MQKIYNLIWAITGVEDVIIEKIMDRTYYACNTINEIYDKETTKNYRPSKILSCVYVAAVLTMEFLVLFAPQMIHNDIITEMVLLAASNEKLVLYAINAIIDRIKRKWMGAK